MIRSLLLLLLVATATARPASAQADCPPENEWGRLSVVEFVGDEWRTASTRTVPVMGPSAVRLLTDATDASLCRSLRQQIPTRPPNPNDPPSDWALTFYQAGSYFFAVRAFTGEPVQIVDGRMRVRHRWQPLFVFDADLRLLASIAR